MTSSVLHGFRRVLIRGLGLITIALFVVLLVVVLWQVFSRQVLSAPSTWSTTAAQYLFVWLTLFGIAFVFAERGHVAVDVVATRLPRPLRRVAVVSVQSSVLLFAVLALIWGGARGVSISWSQAIPGLPVTVGQMYLALPVAGVVIAAVALEDLIRVLRGEELAALESTDDAPDAPRKKV